MKKILAIIFSFGIKYVFTEDQDHLLINQTLEEKQNRFKTNFIQEMTGTWWNYANSSNYTNSSSAYFYHILDI